MFEKKWMKATVGEDANALVAHAPVPFEALVEYFESRLKERFEGLREEPMTSPEKAAQSLTYEHTVEITHEGAPQYQISIYLDRVGSAESPLAGDTLIVLGCSMAQDVPRRSEAAKKAADFLRYLKEPLDDKVAPWNSAAMKWIEDNRGWMLHR